jgi:hypothetical protein
MNKITPPLTKKTTTKRHIAACPLVHCDPDCPRDSNPNDRVPMRPAKLPKKKTKNIDNASAIQIVPETPIQTTEDQCEL